MCSSQSYVEMWWSSLINIAFEAEMKLGEITPTMSPKCLLTRPPKGWKPVSRILPRAGLFARECLYFRSGMCYTIVWLTWALAMVCPSSISNLYRVSVKATLRPQSSIRRQTANQMRRRSFRQSRQRKLSSRGDWTATSRQNHKGPSDYIVTASLCVCVIIGLFPRHACAFRYGRV